MFTPSFWDARKPVLLPFHKPWETDMARVTPLEKEHLEEVSELLDLVEAVMGFVPNSMLTMAHRPEILKTFATMAGTINAPGEVSL